MTKIHCAVLRCKHNHNCACTLHEVKFMNAVHKLMWCDSYEPDKEEIGKWDILSGIPRLSKENDE